MFSIIQILDEIKRFLVYLNSESDLVRLFRLMCILFYKLWVTIVHFLGTFSSILFTFEKIRMIKKSIYLK